VLTTSNKQGIPAFHPITSPFRHPGLAQAIGNDQRREDAKRLERELRNEAIRFGQSDFRLGVVPLAASGDEMARPRAEPRMQRSAHTGRVLHGACKILYRKWLPYHRIAAAIGFSARQKHHL
jgi:hypothetical protein